MRRILLQLALASIAVPADADVQGGRQPEPTAGAERPADPTGAARLPTPARVGAPGLISADALRNYTVHLADSEDFGRIAGIILNIGTGNLESLEISRGGVLGVGDSRYVVPWSQVAAVNTEAREIRVAARRDQLVDKPADGSPAGGR